MLLYKFQSGGFLPSVERFKEEWGLPTSSEKPLRPVQEFKKQFNNKLAAVAPKKAPETFVLEDKRKIRATTQQNIVPERDLKAGTYSTDVVKDIIKVSRQQGVDPATMLAIALAETNLGKTDSNWGHIKESFEGMPTDFIGFYKNKLNETKHLNLNTEALKIQAYNGLGTINGNTEADYHGFKAKSFYGVPVPAGGINLRLNPLYGKEIIDLRENVIKQNPFIQELLAPKPTKNILYKR